MCRKVSIISLFDASFNRSTCNSVFSGAVLVPESTATGSFLQEVKSLFFHSSFIVYQLHSIVKLRAGGYVQCITFDANVYLRGTCIHDWTQEAILNQLSTRSVHDNLLVAMEIGKYIRQLDGWSRHSSNNCKMFRLTWAFDSIVQMTFTFDIVTVPSRAFVPTDNFMSICVAIEAAPIESIRLFSIL